ncbi:unnamed protein product [Protopolystoma xenopodis]|uniref:Uncharacterized protein n=1 Tax=Protopolystoma xenopodis TaxID=117903 RepID=A0A3S5B4L6_9PLAT|nr:unnamed protein product [Protopolystoma xenopodis]
MPPREHKLGWRLQHFALRTVSVLSTASSPQKNPFPAVRLVSYSPPHLPLDTFSSASSIRSHFGFSPLLSIA